MTRGGAPPRLARGGGEVVGPRQPQTQVKSVNAAKLNQSPSRRQAATARQLKAGRDFAAPWRPR